jgi:hypothetical protein
MVDARWLVNIPESIGTKEAIATSARFAADIALAATTKGVAGKSLRAQAEAVLDEVLPAESRIALASRSPMYSKDAAETFAREISEAMPGTMVAKGNVKLVLEDARRSMQPIVDRVAQKHNFPAPKLSVLDEPEATYRGRFEIPQNGLFTNIARFENGKTFAGTMYHELNHGEQVSLIAKKLSDDLGIGIVPTPEQRTALFNSFATGLSLERKAGGKAAWLGGVKDDTQRYLDELLALRGGIALNGDQARRAEQLYGSFRHVPDDYTIAIRSALRGPYSDLSDNLKLHLMYRSRVHELEAFEMTKLFE